MKLEVMWITRGDSASMFQDLARRRGFWEVGWGLLTASTDPTLSHTHTSSFNMVGRPLGQP